MLIVILAVVLYTCYTRARINISAANFDDESFHNEIKTLNKKFWWFFLLNPLLLVVLIKELVKRKKLQKRFEPILDSSNNLMIRLNRDENKEGHPFISQGQHQEEILGVYDYDIWQSADKKEYQIVTNTEDNFNEYANCPKCKFKTLSKPMVVTIRQATYSSEGSAKEILHCANCKYEKLIKNIVIAVKQRSSSSSSSSSSSRSSSSSSSRSSSFGGGSSSGGGSGGSW